MKYRRTVRSVSAVAIAALAGGTLSACGGDAQGAAMPTMTMVPIQSAAPTVTNAGPLAVTIKDFAFSPAALTVHVGQTVTWTNQDEEPHTVIGDSGGPHSGVLGNAGTAYRFRFTRPGTYSYVCSIHPFMHGTVTVTA